MSRAALLAVLLTVPALSRAEAQAPSALEGEVHRLEQVVDSLHRQVGDVSTLAAATPEVRVAAPRHDDLELLTVEGFRIRTNRSVLPVRDGATLAWQRLRAYFGDVLDRAPIAPLMIEALDPDSGTGVWDDVAELTVHWDLSADQLAARIVDARAPVTDDRELTEWFGGSPHPLASPSAAMASSYLNLVLSSYSPGRDCAFGDLRGCRAALRLLPDSAPVEAFYPTPRDRRQVAATMERSPHGPALRPLLDRCLIAEIEAGCTAVVEALGVSARPAITEAQTRRTLLEFALHTGGAAAYTRLLASRGAPMGERLADAAQLPLDTLLSRWRLEVVRGQETNDPWSFGILGGGVVWVVVLAFAAMTSSRWRVD